MYENQHLKLNIEYLNTEIYDDPDFVATKTRAVKAEKGSFVARNVSESVVATPMHSLLSSFVLKSTKPKVLVLIDGNKCMVSCQLSSRVEMIPPPNRNLVSSRIHRTRIKRRRGSCAVSERRDCAVYFQLSLCRYRLRDRSSRLCRCWLAVVEIPSSGARQKGFASVHPGVQSTSAVCDG